MKLGILKVKSFFAVLLISVSFSANSTVILEMSGVTTGVPFPGWNYHSIDKASAVLTSNFGFSLSSVEQQYLGLDLSGANYLLNDSELALFETSIGTDSIVDNGTSSYLSVAKDAYIYDVLTANVLYSGTLSIESEYFYPSESVDGFGSFTMSFDDPSVIPPQAVPEPGVVGLLSLGLVGLGFASKRKQSQLK